MSAKTTARMLQGTPRNLEMLAHALRAGELVAVPTETVYGLAGNAFDPAACRAIFRAKGRPHDDPLIVHVHSLAQLSEVAEANPAALKLARKYWPGPLTIVLPKRPEVPDLVSAGLPSVAVRMPSHRLFRRLLRLAAVPLAAPSANPFGYISPTCAEHVRQSLGSRIKFILDGGAAQVGVESTIVDLRDPKKPRLLRPGAITRVQLQRALGCRVLAAKPAAVTGPQIAPGRLTRHYSPRTPVELHTRITAKMVKNSDVKEAWVFAARPRSLAGSNIYWLDAKGALPAVARRLFHTLRAADAAGYEKIHIERARGRGLAEAINDRLTRAAAR